MNYTEKRELLETAFGAIMLYRLPVQAMPTVLFFGPGMTTMPTKGESHSFIQIKGESFTAPTDDGAIDAAWDHFFGKPETETLALPDDWEAV